MEVGGGLAYFGIFKWRRERRESRRGSGGYCSAICTAVRAVDPNHLIFGDRFNGNRDIPKGVLQAVKKHLDVLSVQYFCEPSDTSRARMVQDVEERQKHCGKPVLVADIGNWCATAMDPQRASALRGQRERREDYMSMLGLLMGREWCVGFCWCGYVENRGEGGGELFIRLMSRMGR